MPTRNIIIGLDVGATKIACGAVSNGEVVRRTSVPTGGKGGPKRILANIETVLEKLLSEYGTKKVGIGIAGATDGKRGMFVEGPNFPKGFRNIKIADVLHRRFGVDVRIDNDVHCFTLGEARYGAGKGRSRVFGMTLGTGIGGGIVVDGKPVRGAHNTAGEVGHIMMRLDGEARCGCGKRGHLEAYASGTGISRRYRERTDLDLSAADIAARARKGDRQAIAVFDDASRTLAAGIADIAHLLDPEIVIIGGGLSKEPLIWKGLRGRIRELLVYPDLKKLQIARSRLHENANILGAAALHDRRIR